MAYPVESIRQEYDQAAAAGPEFAKVKWASQEKMLNRFRLAMAELPFDRAQSWLDVGCGTGAFQAMALARHPSLRCVALDLSQELLRYASARPDALGVEFVQGDFAQCRLTGFDLLTCVGVLQKSNLTPTGFFERAAEALNPGGMLFLDTKHLGWRRFQEPGFDPEPEITWFDRDELESAARQAGLTVRTVGGFLPGRGLVVPPQDSHTIFMIARRDDAA